MRFIKIGQHNELFSTLLTTDPGRVAAMVVGQKAYLEELKAQGKLIEGYWTPGYGPRDGLCVTLWEVDSADELDRCTLGDPCGPIFSEKSYPVTDLFDHFDTALTAHHGKD